MSAPTGGRRDTALVVAIIVGLNRNAYQESANWDPGWIGFRISDCRIDEASLSYVSMGMGYWV